MPEKNKSQSSESEAPLPVDYAFWEVAEASFKVIYSLPLFHEIDFVVNEGYRKIPHGGIEVGGLLFGSVDKESVRIEAFRPIECEHASGPSWNLSDRDLAALKDQISASAFDAELEKLQPVGWFLAHTRGAMELTEVEAKQFDQFFPEPFKVTVLIKPERFQPTRFGFLVRQADATMPRDAAATAVILPLPGRSHKAGQLIPSLTAPKPASITKRPLQDKGTPKVLADDFQAAVAESKLPLSIWKVPPDEESEPAAEAIQAEAIQEERGEQMPEFRTPAERAARRQLSRDRARVIEEAFPSPTPQAAPFRPPALPSLPANAIHLPSAYDRYPQVREEPDGEQHPAGADSVLNPKSVTALAVAALLGCLVGYIAYLQLPAPVIPIDVRPVNLTMVVSWPPDETKNSIYAAIRLNDGPPVPLSAEEKKTGQVSLTAAKDFKVEVIARNWVRDSRGIVRYLHSANGNGQVVPTEAPPIP